jgi:hypothetical protein
VDAVAVLALLPAEAAVVAARRAEAAPLHAEAVGAELTRRAEAVVVPLRAEAAAVEIPRAEAAVLARRAEAVYARQGQVTVRQEAYDCREASRCSLQGRLLHPRCPATAHREAHDCPEWSERCLDRVSHLVLPARCRSFRH